MTWFKPARNRTQFMLASALIIGLALWVRTYNLYALPKFVDEVNHLRWAQNFALGDSSYPLLMDGKMLSIMLLSLFPVNGPVPLWTARAAVALFATIGCSATIATGKHVGTPAAGLLAGVLYAFLPFTVFHDRQVLADSLMADFGAVAIFFAFQTAQLRGWRIVLFLALSLTATILAKLFGAVYVVVLAWIVILLPTSWKERRALVGRYSVAGVLAAVFIGLFLITFASRLGYNDAKLVNQGVGFVGCPAILCEGDLEKQLTNFQGAWESVRDAISQYIGWPTILLATLAGVVADKQHRRKVAVLGLTALTILLGLMSGVGIGQHVVLPARYIVIIALPIAILAAYTLLRAAQRGVSLLKSAGLQQYRPLAVMVISSGLFLTMAPTMANTVPILVNARTGHYTAFDLYQYYGWDYGLYSFYEAVETIEARESNNPQPPIVIVYGKHDDPLAAIRNYFNRIGVGLKFRDDVHAVDIGRWLVEGRGIYLINEIDPAEPREISTPSGMVSEEIGRYRRGNFWDRNWTIRLRVMVSADPALYEAIFRESFIWPEKLTTEYETLAASLPQTGSTTLLVYPPNQAEALTPLVTAAYPTTTVVPIGDMWPLEAKAVETELGAATQGAETIKMVFVEETHGDRNRVIETWLNTHLYRVDEQWFGPVRVVSFANSGQTSQTLTVQSKFGEAIRLESIELADATVAPGGLLRLRLNWKALGLVAQNFKVFTHVIAGDSIVAQHDGQPVGELRPTSSWQRDEAIIDQFAIQIPVEAPPGSYELRIGMYDLETQARLPFLRPDGSQAEFFVGGEVVIK